MIRPACCPGLGRFDATRTCCESCHAGECCAALRLARTQRDQLGEDLQAAQDRSGLGGADHEAEEHLRELRRAQEREQGERNA